MMRKCRLAAVAALCGLSARAEANFASADGMCPPDDVRVNSRQLGILTPKAGAKPRINGATVLGVRPGHPILFKVPVTGEAPMTVQVERGLGGSGGLAGLGLKFDHPTRILSGAIAEPGEYRLVFKAKNAKGRAERDFTVKVGETIALTPAMGWAAWNGFSGKVTAEKVRAAADAMVSSGLSDHGWQDVRVDGFGGNDEKRDMFDPWKSVSASIERQKHLWHASKPGAWNDPGMLCVGRMTWNGFTGTRLSPNEQYTQVSLWALVAAPLTIGCDMTELDDFTLCLLTNDEVIEIDQDPLGKGAACIVDDMARAYEIWARPLADGSVAVGLYNKSVKEQRIAFDLEKAGLLCKWKVRDVWRQEDVGVFLGTYETSVPGHATELLKLTPLACGRLRPGLTDIRENAWKSEVGKSKR